MPLPPPHNSCLMFKCVMTTFPIIFVLGCCSMSRPIQPVTCTDLHHFEFIVTRAFLDNLHIRHPAEEKNARNFVLTITTPPMPPSSPYWVIDIPPPFHCPLFLYFSVLCLSSHYKSHPASPLFATFPSVIKYTEQKSAMLGWCCFA